jgi:DNA repair protein RecN (Recombination protein N)
VTHLPQVAAFAERHHRVEKRVSAGRTATSVALLDGDDARRREIARMIAGATVTDSAIEHAGALIAAARAPLPPAERGRRAAPARAAARRVTATAPDR